MRLGMDHPISFLTQGLTLSGILHLPNQAPSAVVIGCHGLMADKNSPKQIQLAKRCTALGMAYCRFDHRGCGQSEGRFKSDTTLENRNADLIGAVQTIKAVLGGNLPIGLFGSSFGGTVCLSAARMISPFAIVTLAAPVQSRSICWPDDTPRSLIKEMVDTPLSFDITEQTGSIDHILVIHGYRDETVPHSNAHTIYQLAKDPKRILILADGDHRLSNPANQKTFLHAAVQWFGSFLGSAVRGSMGQG